MDLTKRQKVKKYMITQEEALKLIDEHKSKLAHPVEMLKWTYLRVIINEIDIRSWVEARNKAMEICSR